MSIIEVLPPFRVGPLWVACVLDDDRVPARRVRLARLGLTRNHAIRRRAVAVSLGKLLP